MIGQRLADGYDETQPIPNGAYWIDWQGRWSVKTPNGRIGALDDHTVEQHSDGTITVSPSILVEERPLADRTLPGFHGYLEHGVWRSC